MSFSGCDTVLCSCARHPPSRWWACPRRHRALDSEQMRGCREEKAGPVDMDCADSSQEASQGAAAEAQGRSGAASQCCSVTVEAARLSHTLLFLGQNLLQQLCEKLWQFGHVTPGGRTFPGLLQQVLSTYWVETTSADSPRLCPSHRSRL